jgi:alpha-beta hydrolase superfamily lysophospholipase
MAMQFALNGFDSVMVDLEGFGFSNGVRINNMAIEKFEHQIVAALSQVDQTLPCFLLGHSMGGLAVNAFLARNK